MGLADSSGDTQVAFNYRTYDTVEKAKVAYQGYVGRAGGTVNESRATMSLAQVGDGSIAYSSFDPKKLTDFARLLVYRARGRAYDVTGHQQAAMPELLLAHQDADPEDDDQEPQAGPRSGIDMTALRALKESRTDVEPLDLTDERLHHLQDAFTKAAAPARETMVRSTDQEDSVAPHPAREDEPRAHRPQQSDRHRGPGVGR
ncbi:hypothetical protein [Streptomyces sp. NPDC056883]|uniref:hypothetical protein n=1 Tax=Streptomyces sp. NPDC056883 TaxID=3345959 RepID=UPI003675463F